MLNLFCSLVYCACFSCTQFSYSKSWLCVMTDNWVVKGLFWYVWFREGHRIRWFTFRAHWWCTFFISYSWRRICWWILNLMWMEYYVLHLYCLTFRVQNLIYLLLTWSLWYSICRNCCRFVLSWKGHTSATRSKYPFPSRLLLLLLFCI